MRGHRSHDHDEVCLPSHQRAEPAHHCQHEPDYGGRDRDVRSLPPDGRERGEIRLCGRTGV